MRKLNPQNYILTLQEAIKWRESLKKQSHRLVFTNGCFDILHRGHVEYLYRAKQLGDVLIVAVNSDNSVRQLKGPERPVNSENDRAFVLASLKIVDAVVIFDSLRCTEILKTLKPDIYVKGGDYTLDTINQEEKQVLIDTGCKIHFIPFVQGYSSSKIISICKGEQN